jgi:Amt family ammonium transporter
MYVGLTSFRQITPAIGFLYAGMHRRKAALTMIFQSLFCACAAGIQFWIYGYSLYQSHTTNPFFGNLSKAGLRNTLASPSLANADIPDILYACFGFTFVTCTAMILAGAMLERGRLGPSMIFLLCWTTFVYYILAHAEWNPSGWLYKLGVYDFAGSGPVHIASGFSALAWAIMLGPRHDPHKESFHPKIPHFRPHNPFLVGLGTILIWFGWYAFNGTFHLIPISESSLKFNRCIWCQHLNPLSVHRGEHQSCVSIVPGTDCA